MESFGSIHKNYIEYDVLVLVMIVLVMILSLFLYNNTIHKHGINDMEKVLRDICIFNHINTCIKTS